MKNEIKGLKTVSQKDFEDTHKAGCEHLYSDPLKAIELGKKACKIARASGSEEHLGQAYHLLGNAYNVAGEGQKAEAWTKKAIKSYKAQGNRRNMALAMGSLAGCYSYKGNLDRALAINEEIGAIFVELGDIRNQITNLSCIANIYERKGEHIKAIQHYSASIDLCAIGAYFNRRYPIDYKPGKRFAPGIWRSHPLYPGGIGNSIQCFRCLGAEENKRG